MRRVPYLFPVSNTTCTTGTAVRRTSDTYLAARPASCGNPAYFMRQMLYSSFVFVCTFSISSYRLRQARTGMISFFSDRLLLTTVKVLYIVEH